MEKLFGFPVVGAPNLKLSSLRAIRALLDVNAVLAHDLIYQSGFIIVFDWNVPEWQAAYDDSTLIESLDTLSCYKFLTTIVRSDRFTGAFLPAVRDGVVQKILDRLIQLESEKKEIRPLVEDTGVPVGVALREHLVDLALAWQEEFGVAPSITSAISEFDAARIIGMPLEKYSSYMSNKTAVSKGADFTYAGIRYQVKANRPSGKPGSRVTLVGKAKNYDWDQLVWILYDQAFNVLECWLWNVEKYRTMFHERKRLSPGDYRKGLKLDVSYK